LNRLRLTVKRPSSLLSKLLEVDINEEQFTAIVLLLSRPDEFIVTRKPPMGFHHPVTSGNDQQGGSDAAR
jgi:hypothetical protein